MAVTSELVRVSYAGNNSTVTPYVIPFQYLADVDVNVVVRTSAGVETTLILTTDYVLSGTGYPTAGGSFTTLVAVPAASTVVVFRRTAQTQTTTYVETDEFPALSHEMALDKATLLIQERKDADERSFRLTDQSSSIASLTPINNTLLGLDASGAAYFQTASEVLTWINLVQTLGNFPTKTWLNAAARATAVPDFIGQVGVQRDTLSVYMGTALSAGSWSAVTAGAPGALSIITSMLATGVLSADATGRGKMAAGYIDNTLINASMVTAQTAATLLADGDHLLGTTAAGLLRRFPGNVAVPPGSVIQTQYAEYTTNADLAVTIPVDDTKPEITEGNLILTRAITPRFADSQILLTFQGSWTINSAFGAIAAIFRDSITTAIAASIFNAAALNLFEPMVLTFLDSPATTSSVSYTVRVGGAGGGIIRLNGLSSGRLLGGASRATLTAQEIKV